MKRISLVLLAITVMAVLAISASAANTVMYSGGGAAQNLVQGDAGALVIELKFDDEEAENPQTFNVDDSDALYVRFFVEDADALTGNGQIEISSSGTCDQQEYNYNPFAYEIVSGWNELELYLWEGQETGGSPDFTKINYFRIYLFTDGANAVALDYVAFGDEGEDLSSIATDIGEIVKEEVVLTNELTDHAESDTLSTLSACNRIPEDICDVTNYDYLFARIYVEGIDNFTGEGQLEICSKPSPDLQEVHWDVNTLELQDGWNELKLDTYLASSYDESFNRANAQFFRLYMFTSGNLKLDLDYVGFSNEDSDPNSLPVYLVKPAAERAEEAPADEATEETTAETEAAVAETEAAAETETAEETEAVEETAAAEETVDETVATEEPAAETTAAPQTFDAAVVAAIAAVAASAGAYIASKKRR